MIRESIGNKEMKISKRKIGIAGEYFVAAELSKKGYVASITLRNTEGVDILVSNEDGSITKAIQVKSSIEKKKSWILNKKAESNYNDNLFYVFVNLKEDEERADYYIVPSVDVAKFVRKSHRNWLKKPGKSGKAHKDSDMRKFADPEDKYLERWDLLGL